MEPDRVAFLACGWSLARADAHGTAVALQSDDGTILVDAGGDVAKQLVRVDGLENLRRIYLTHEHPDHLWGFPGLVHCLRFTDRERGLEVAGPEIALARARESLEALGVTYPFDLDWHPIDAEAGSDNFARWRPTSHSVDTLGYRFGDVTVLGDTRPTEELVELARGSSLLVHEATHTDEDRCHSTGHSTPSDAGDVAARADVDALALIHIHPSLPTEEAVKRSGFPDTFAPSDGDVAVRQGTNWQNKPST